ncbi:MAG: hypothetical protein AMQ74_01952 [Candidatus Methanofastidiosum methylothiophilum]|uniref:Uncharacterized protein n=1 Tax=Candidatus Methanofastidiosum methylothiophilum TaxID=1705564 RepID=A0A150IIB4_9EURY|nr:MAG: hypothetical protein AMQ74_01952 [Candidatus Methanofastidiosum methylthiophilus]
MQSVEKEAIADIRGGYKVFSCGWQYNNRGRFRCIYLGNGEKIGEYFRCYQWVTASWEEGGEIHTYVDKGAHHLLEDHKKALDSIKDKTFDEAILNLEDIGYARMSGFGPEIDIGNKKAMGNSK